MQQSHINLADDPGAVNKAKHKGRAYKCISCHYKEGKETIDVKGRIEEHILKNHVSLDEIPYYCRLCLFRCQRHEQLIQHITNYARHREMAAKRNITDHTPFLVTSPNPHQFSDLDYMKLTPEASLRFFLKQHGTQKSSPVTSALQQIGTGQLEGDLFQTTVDAGYITPLSSPTEQYCTTHKFARSASSLVAQDFTGNLIPRVQAVSQQPAFQVDVPQTRTAAVQNAVPQLQVSETLQPIQSILSLLTGVPGIQTLLTSPEALPPQEPAMETPQLSVSRPAMNAATCQSQGSGGVESEEVPRDADRTNKPREVTSPEADACPNYIPTPLDQLAQRKKGKTVHVGTCDVVMPEDIAENVDFGFEPTDFEEVATEAGQETYEEDEASAVEKNLMQQLLMNEDTTLSTPRKKRVRNGSEDSVAPKKMKETGTQDYTFDIGQVANGLQEALQKLTGVMEKFAKANERMEKALVENTCMVSKAVDAISRLKKTMEEHERSEQRKEERREEAERRREEARRREREEDRKREERRWQQERRERGERRRAEEKRSKGNENKSETKQHEEAKGEKEAEKEGRPRTTLGRSFTKNTMVDFTSGRKR